MNNKINAILSNAEGRYLNAQEQKYILDYAKTLDARMAAAKEIEQKEYAIVSNAMDNLMKAYPDYEKKFQSASNKGNRDQTLVLRYATQAMVRADHRYLEDALLIWMNTILSGLGFTGGFLSDAYEMLKKSMNTECSAETCELMNPFLDQCIVSLSAQRSEENEAANA